MIDKCQLCGAPGGYLYCNRDCEKADADDAIRYTADVVAVMDDGHVLLIERGWDPYAGHWALPGGHVDPGETSRTAAVRELEEETGVRVDPDDLREIGVFDAPDRDPRGRYVSAAYLTHVPAGTQAVAGDDARTAGWFPPDALPQLAFDHDSILWAALDASSLRSAYDSIDAALVAESDHGRASALYEVLLQLGALQPHTCARSEGLHSKDCPRYVPGHELLSQANGLKAYWRERRADAAESQQR